MLLGRHSSTSDWITFGRKLINHSILANVVSQIYLYKWSDHTWQEFCALWQTYLYMWFDHTCRNLLYQPKYHTYLYKWFSGTKCVTPIWPMLLRTHTCTRDLITLGRNLIYHSILKSVLKHNILVKVIRLHLPGTFHSD
jgi:hypothetical protein